MAQFPILKTGSTAQYPLTTSVTSPVDIVWFLDGSEQRFRRVPSPLHSWKITLELLDEQEMSDVLNFFLDNAGRAGVFAFTDPATGTVYPNCSFSADQLDLTYVGPSRGKTIITIMENRI